MNYLCLIITKGILPNLWKWKKILEICYFFTRLNEIRLFRILLFEVECKHTQTRSFGVGPPAVSLPLHNQQVQDQIDIRSSRWSITHIFSHQRLTPTPFLLFSYLRKGKQWWNVIKMANNTPCWFNFDKEILFNLYDSEILNKSIFKSKTNNANLISLIKGHIQFR